MRERQYEGEKIRERWNMREREYEGGAEEPVNLCGRRRIHRPSGAGQNRTGSRSVPSNKTGNWSLLGCNI